MTTLKPEALIELGIFKELALAIKSNDYDAIAASQQFKEHYETSRLFDEHGNKLPDFNKLVMERLVNIFDDSSFANCSAYEIDKMLDPDLKECNEIHRFAKVGNEAKHYSRFCVCHGDYMSGEVIISNHGELKIIAGDNSYTILHVEDYTIASPNLFYELADFAIDHSDKDNDPYFLENSIEEDLHYFNSSKATQFENKQDYLNYKITKLIDAIETSVHLDDEYDIDEYYDEEKRQFITELLTSKTESSFIILEDELIIENDGNVCIIAFDEHRITVAQAGEEFDLRGEPHTAGPHVLKAVDMQLYGDETFEFNHREDIPETQLKKTKIRKPGR
ncbi:hypothetical protein [Pseudomonas sp. HY7a-MNA-CIBAN-0227]|uniref:hypothetical protein n=1 Tax=Pseudomonas sp. HY7a-MNA-CIBAN-0227 TaxID=3140474 RepID=UPI00331EB147